MKRRFTMVIVFVLFMIMMLGWTGAMADFEPFASTRFFTKSVSLSTSLSVTFRAEKFETSKSTIFVEEGMANRLSTDSQKEAKEVKRS